MHDCALFGGAGRRVLQRCQDCTEHAILRLQRALAGPRDTGPGAPGEAPRSTQCAVDERPGVRAEQHRRRLRVSPGDMRRPHTLAAATQLMHNGAAEQAATADHPGRHGHRWPSMLLRRVTAGVRCWAGTACARPSGPAPGSLVMRYAGFPIAMFTLTPMYSAMTPRENRIAPVLRRTTTIVEVQPRIPLAVALAKKILEAKM